MKIVGSVACLLICALPLGAQITAILNPLPNGSTEVRLRNNSEVPLTAFAISVDSTRAISGLNDSLTLWADPAVHSFPAVKSSNVETVTGLVPPNDEFTWLPKRATIVTAKSGHLLLDQPVAAGIFADGTTAGDAVLLARLIERRRNMLLAVEMSLETLLGADGRNVPRDQLIERFELMADSARRWYLPPEQQVGLGLYRSFIGKLVNLTEEEAGSTFPPSSFLERETALLNRQRVDLLEVLQSNPGLTHMARN